MKFLIFKDSDELFYDIKEINTIEELTQISEYPILIENNIFQKNKFMEAEILENLKGITKEDISLIKSLKYILTICD